MELMTSSDDYDEDEEFVEDSSIDSGVKKYFYDGSKLHSTESADRKQELVKRKEEVISILNKSCCDDEDGVGLLTDEENLLSSTDDPKKASKKH
jgi:hypothetical protein